MPFSPNLSRLTGAGLSLATVANLMLTPIVNAASPQSHTGKYAATLSSKKANPPGEIVAWLKENYQATAVSVLKSPQADFIMNTIDSLVRHQFTELEPVSIKDVIVYDGGQRHFAMDGRIEGQEKNARLIIHRDFLRQLREPPDSIHTTTALWSISHEWMHAETYLHAEVVERIFAAPRGQALKAKLDTLIKREMRWCLQEIEPYLSQSEIVPLKESMVKSAWNETIADMVGLAFTNFKDITTELQEPDSNSVTESTSTCKQIFKATAHSKDPLFIKERHMALHALKNFHLSHSGREEAMYAMEKNWPFKTPPGPYLQQALRDQQRNAGYTRQ